MSFITNVTAAAIINATGAWTIQGGFPTVVDEVVIRQITYASPGVSIELYLVHSNIGQQIIGTVANTPGFNTTPGTRIILRNPLPNVLSFQLMHPDSPPIPVITASGDAISISMDFIRYS